VPCYLRFFAKVARTAVAAVIGTLHDVFFPRHAPLHAEKRQPFAAFAVRKTAVYDANGFVQPL
jgi:hypothetical protein